jgi:L-arabinose isomerase
MTLEIRKDAEIWFLTGSQGLYGEETLQQVAEQSQEVAQILAQNSEIPIKIVWKPVLLTPDAIRRACLDATADDNCLGVIVWMHTFSPAKMWIAGLSALQKPLLHFSTQLNSQLPWATLDMDFMNLNQAAHGDREHGHIAARLNTARKVVVGHAAEPHTVTRISDWVYAAIGWDSAQRLKLARFGDNMRFVAVTDGDKTSAQMQFGMSIEAYGVNTLVEAVQGATKAEIDSVVDEYLSLYEVAPELQKSGNRHESLRYGADIEVGLHGFLKTGGFSAFTTNFEDLGALRQLPGLAVQRAMAKGYGFGGEGDWKTSALLRIVKRMERAGQGGTSFMEDYTYHFGPGEPKVLGAHMLEVCPTITSKRPKIEIHPLGIGGREDPVRMVFNADPAPGQVIALMDLGDRFRIITNKVEVVNPDVPLLKLPVAFAVWKPKPSLATSAESWIYAGGSHHTVLTTALGPETLADFAKIAGVELLVIDEDTRIDQFQREIRWNASHFSNTGN